MTHGIPEPRSFRSLEALGSQLALASDLVHALHEHVMVHDRESLPRVRVSVERVGEDRPAEMVRVAFVLPGGHPCAAEIHEDGMSLFLPDPEGKTISLRWPLGNDPDAEKAWVDVLGDCEWLDNEPGVWEPQEWADFGQALVEWAEFLSRPAGE